MFNWIELRICNFIFFPPLLACQRHKWIFAIQLQNQPPVQYSVFSVSSNLIAAAPILNDHWLGTCPRRSQHGGQGVNGALAAKADLVTMEATRGSCYQCTRGTTVSRRGWVEITGDKWTTSFTPSKYRMRITFCPTLCLHWFGVAVKESRIDST